MANALAFIQAMRDITALIKAQWGTTSGKVPEILILWDEKMLTYNKTDSYILLSTTPEITKRFSMQKGSGDYHWYHTVPMELDIRVYKSNPADLLPRFEQVVNNVETILKNNIRLVVNGNVYIRIVLRTADPDFTRKQTARLVRHIDLEKLDP